LEPIGIIDMNGKSEKSEYFCKHEEEFGQLKQICLVAIPKMDIKVNKIFDRISGTNGEKGISTRLAMIEQILNNMPSHRRAMQWGALWGGISGAITISLFLGIKEFIK